ncbi:MAG: PP2C family protein-serine/threonine phosphatase [Acidimicrobiia bacterium]
MSRLDLELALRAARDAPDSIPEILRRAAAPMGATEVIVYLVDFAHTTLEPLPDRSPHRAVPHSEPVDSSLAGRTFVSGTCATAERSDGHWVWAPIVEGTDRTGVVALGFTEARDDAIEAAEEAGLLTGYLIATHARTTDFYSLYRRRRSLSLAASMQWDILPPLVLKTAGVVITGLIEPAYDVGGDFFDYALNGSVLDFAIVDAMGHGVTSALVSALIAGCYRHDRREGQSLDSMHQQLERVLAQYWPKLTFATGQLGQLDVDTGQLQWTNAGHPLPLLVRGGQVVGELECAPTLPWGIAAGAGRNDPPGVATVALEPGDGVLFYTDGVVEARVNGGEMFGIERLIDHVGRHASDQEEPEEVVRHIANSVLEYRAAELADDATLVMVRWNGPDRI